MYTLGTVDVLSCNETRAGERVMVTISDHPFGYSIWLYFSPQQLYLPTLQSITVS